MVRVMDTPITSAMSSTTRNNPPTTARIIGYSPWNSSDFNENRTSEISEGRV